MKVAIHAAERGWLPDHVVRVGIRRLVGTRLATLRSLAESGSEAVTDAFVHNMDLAKIAPSPCRANQQHYELPAEFFSWILGRRMKYSCCYWQPNTTDLDQAEEDTLRIYCERASIEDGMRILDLGCGWGALTLWIAAHYPHARVTAMSNSTSQCTWIRTRAAGLDNIEVICRDVNEYIPDVRYDRILSVEMFEHVRNYRLLLSRIADWLLPGGRFFMHIFCHRELPYVFDTRSANDWMGQHFFTGGIMPSALLPMHFQDHLAIEHHWYWNGTHYQRTAEAWLANMDRHAEALAAILEHAYPGSMRQWRNRWRIFFASCAELFGYNNGQHWGVGHYLYAP